MPIINPKYRGNFSVAITTFAGDYNYLCALPEQLWQALKYTRETLGPKFRELKIYGGVDLEKVEPIINKAIADIKSGKRIDLEGLIR